METIITTIKEKIKSLKWDENYYQEALKKASEQINQLEKELEQLIGKQSPTISN